MTKTKIEIIEPAEEIVPTSEHRPMPLWLLIVWIVNVAFFLTYFVRFALPDLQNWLER